MSGKRQPPEKSVDSTEDEAQDVLLHVSASNTMSSDAKRQKKEDTQNEKTHNQRNTEGFQFKNDLTLEKLREIVIGFNKERNWDQFHRPRNVLLDLVAEVGELSEIFQWKDEVDFGLPDFTEKEIEHVGQELSDVLMCVINMADKCKIDLSTAVIDKLEHNRRKYPVEKCYGNCLKYTEFENKDEGK